MTALSVLCSPPRSGVFIAVVQVAVGLPSHPFLKSFLFQPPKQIKLVVRSSTSQSSWLSGVPPSYPAVPSRGYLEPPPSCHPILSDGYEIHPSLLAMVRAQSFSGKKDKCPYAHLQIFEENCSLLIIPDMTQNTLQWKLFPFSLTWEAKIWYNRTARRVGGDWI